MIRTKSASSAFGLTLIMYQNKIKSNQTKFDFSFCIRTLTKSKNTSNAIYTRKPNETINQISLIIY